MPVLKLLLQVPITNKVAYPMLLLLLRQEIRVCLLGRVQTPSFYLAQASPVSTLWFETQRDAKRTSQPDVYILFFTVRFSFKQDIHRWWGKLVARRFHLNWATRNQLRSLFHWYTETLLRGMPWHCWWYTSYWVRTHIRLHVVIYKVGIVGGWRRLSQQSAWVTALRVWVRALEMQSLVQQHVCAWKARVTRQEMEIGQPMGKLWSQPAQTVIQSSRPLRDSILNKKVGDIWRMMPTLFLCDG